MAYQSDQPQVHNSILKPQALPGNDDMLVHMKTLIIDQDAFASHDQAHALVYSRKLEAFKNNDLDTGLAMFGNKCVADLKSFQHFIKDAEDDEIGAYTTKVRVRTYWGHTREHRATICVQNGFVKIKVAKKESVNWSKRMVKGAAIVIGVVTVAIGAHYVYLKQNGEKWDKETRHKSMLSPLYKTLDVATQYVAKPAVGLISDHGAQMLSHFADEFF